MLLLLSCERLVDFPQDNSGKIHINAIVAGADSRINVMVSNMVKVHGREPMEPFTKANGWTMSAKEKADISGQTVTNMKVVGKITCPMVKVN